MAKSKSKSKSVPKARNRGLLTAAEGAVAKGYSVGKNLGDVEITMEQIYNKIGIVICSIILIVVIVSVLYQIVNVIYRSITGKSLCDLMGMCSKEAPHNLFYLTPITIKSRVIKCDNASGEPSLEVCRSNYELRESDGCNHCEFGQVDMNDLRGNVIQMFITICCMIIVILIITSLFASHRINDIGRHNSAYRAAKGAQFVGNMYNKIRSNK